MPRAPRRCPAPDCPTLISGADRYCPDHRKVWAGQTTGQGSTRASRKAREDCLTKAKHRCQLRHPGCTGRATDAHHPTGLANTGRRRGQAVDSGQLVAACPNCHGLETLDQQRQGRQRANRRH